MDEDEDHRTVLGARGMLERIGRAPGRGRIWVEEEWWGHFLGEERGALLLIRVSAYLSPVWRGEARIGVWGRHGEGDRFKVERTRWWRRGEGRQAGEAGELM